MLLGQILKQKKNETQTVGAENFSCGWYACLPNLTEYCEELSTELFINKNASILADG